MRQLVAVLVTMGLLLSSGVAVAGPGDTVYAGCSTDKAVTVDQYGVQVVCTELPVASGYVWTPVLKPSPFPSVVAYDPCPVPGLVGKEGSATRVCVRAFNGFYYWPLAV